MESGMLEVRRILCPVDSSECSRAWSEVDKV